MQVLAEAGWVGWAQIVVAAGGLVWALVAAVLLGLRWKVPPFVATAPLFLHGLLLAVAGLVASSQMDTQGVEPAVKASFVASAVAMVIHNHTLAIAALPSALVLLLGGAAAGVRGRRAWGAPVLVALVGIAAALMPVAGLFQQVPLPLVVIRVGLYGIALIPLVGALAGANSLDNSREGGLVAAAAFATVVAVGESLTIGQLWNTGFRALAVVAGSDKGAFLKAMIAELQGYGTLAGIVLALAAVPAVVALLRPPVDLTEEEILSGATSPSTMRWLGGALALTVPLVWGAAFVAAAPVGLMTQVAALYTSG